LTTIHQLDNLIRLDCRDCTSLTTIPQLDNLRELWCYDCTSLISISQLINLIKINCDDSLVVEMRNIGYMPNVENQHHKFSSRNEYYYKLKLAKPYLKKILGKSSGFLNDLMVMLEQH